jgi:hypothetical protein
MRRRTGVHLQAEEQTIHYATASKARIAQCPGYRAFYTGGQAVEVWAPSIQISIALIYACTRSRIFTSLCLHGHRYNSALIEEMRTSQNIKVAIFWDIGSCSPYMNQRFGGTYCLDLQGQESAREEQGKKTAS